MQFKKMKGKQLFNLKLVYSQMQFKNITQGKQLFNLKLVYSQMQFKKMKGKQNEREATL